MTTPLHHDRLAQLHPECFGWALTCARGNREEAEEMLQTAYQRILGGRAQFGGRASFKTWVFGVIRRTGLEQRRKHALRRILFERVTRHAGEAVIVPPSSRECLEARDLSTRLRSHLKKLPRRQGEVLMLVFYHHLSLAETAVALEISAGSVRRHYDRGKNRLRKLIARDPALSESLSKPYRRAYPHHHESYRSKLAF